PEPKHDAILVGVDAIKPGKTPDENRTEQDQDHAFAAEITARQHSAQPVLTAPQELFEIGRGRAAGWLLAGAPPALPPGPPGAAALIAPRHGMSPRSPARPAGPISGGYTGAATPLQRKRQACGGAAQRVERFLNAGRGFLSRSPFADYR